MAILFVCRQKPGTGSGQGHDRLCEKIGEKTGPIPRWGGGKASFTSLLSDGIRRKIDDASKGKYEGPEMKALKPLLEKHQELSLLPNRINC